jgi:hypothetical protein
MNRSQLLKAHSLLRDARTGLGPVVEGLCKAIEDGDQARIWAKLEALQSRRNDLTYALEILIAETKQSKTPG